MAATIGPFHLQTSGTIGDHFFFARSRWSDDYREGEVVTKTCEWCGKTFDTNKVDKRFCTKKCLTAEFGSRPVTVQCPDCHETRTITYKRFRSNKSGGVCSTCANAARSGPAAPGWKGGARHWSPGRFGRDKDGLSWKVQRRLAWERDNYTCQECGTKPKRNPDVHHIIPFRVSQSHALENLRCLCQRCHSIAEAQVQSPWGGALIVRPVKQMKPKNSCSCGATTKRLGTLKLCWKCWRPILVEAVVHKTMRQIAKEFEISYHTVDFILHPWTKSARIDVDYTHCPRISSVS